MMQSIFKQGPHFMITCIPKTKIYQQFYNFIVIKNKDGIIAILSLYCIVLQYHVGGI